MDNNYILQLGKPKAPPEATGWLMVEPDLEAISHFSWQVGLPLGRVWDSGYNLWKPHPSPS